MFDEVDERNQRTLEQQNPMEKPLISNGAVRVLAWPNYVAIGLIVGVVVVLLVVQAIG